MFTVGPCALEQGYVNVNTLSVLVTVHITLYCTRPTDIKAALNLEPGIAQSLLTDLFAQTRAQDGPGRAHHRAGSVATPSRPLVQTLQRHRRHEPGPSQRGEGLLGPVHRPQLGALLHLTQQLLGAACAPAEPSVGHAVLVGTDVVLHGPLQPRAQHAGRHGAPPQPLDHGQRLGQVVLVQVGRVAPGPAARCSPHFVPTGTAAAAAVILVLVLPPVIFLLHLLLLLLLGAAAEGGVTLVLRGQGGSLPALAGGGRVRPHVFCAEGGPRRQALGVQVILVGSRGSAGAAAPLEAELWGDRGAARRRPRGRLVISGAGRGGGGGRQVWTGAQAGVLQVLHGGQAAGVGELGEQGAGGGQRLVDVGVQEVGEEGEEEHHPGQHAHQHQLPPLPHAGLHRPALAGAHLFGRSRAPWVSWRA